MGKVDDEHSNVSELEALRSENLTGDDFDRLSERYMRQSKRHLSKRKIQIGGAAIVTFFLLLLILILTLVFYPWEVDPSLFFPIRNCGGDGFSVLYYNHTDRSENVVKRFFKYKYVEDIENDKFYNFEQAKDKCKELNSTLWEILDGPEEWDGVISMAREKDLTGIWLNAKVTGSCPDYSETCLENEAELGKGISVRWPSSRHSRYSRLHSIAADDKQCVFIDKLTDELLWMTANCDKKGFWGLCVKRDCLPE